MISKTVYMYIFISILVFLIFILSLYIYLRYKFNFSSRISVIFSLFFILVVYTSVFICLPAFNDHMYMLYNNVEPVELCDKYGVEHSKNLLMMIVPIMFIVYVIITAVCVSYLLKMGPNLPTTRIGIIAVIVVSVIVSVGLIVPVMISSMWLVKETKPSSC
jgi:hypothetical protein